jgi:hypothetical protein
MTGVDKAQIITLVLSSAAIGALVSSIITLTGQYFERKARREELLLTKSIELAVQRTNTIIDAAKHGDRPAVLEDNAVLAEKYYQWLRHLIKHNAVPDEAKTKKVFRGGLRLDLLRLAWTVQAGL